MTPKEEQNLKKTLSKTTYNSMFTQPKVLFTGQFNATTTATTITHNLGKIPYVRLWAEQLTGEITVPVLVSNFTSYHSRYLTVPNVLYYLTNNSLVINTSTSTCKVTYRIYDI